MTTTPIAKTPAAVRKVVQSASDSLYLELQVLEAGQQTLEEYHTRVASWMRMLADNVGIERKGWEVSD